jgi:hypothetical protein
VTWGVTKRGRNGPKEEDAFHPISYVVKEQRDREPYGLLSSSRARGQRTRGPRVVVRTRCLPRTVIGSAEDSL